MRYLLGSVIVMAAASFSTAVYAQDLVYEPINPSFGGNSFNSSHLLAIANAQNDYERPQDEPSSQDDLDRFIRSLQSRLLSALSTQVSNAIFGEDAQDSGTIVFGDQTIEFVRTLEGVELTIIEADGSRTVITIPTLMTTTNSDDDDDNGDTSGKSGNQSLVALSPTTNLLSGSNLGKPNSLLADDPLARSPALPEPLVQSGQQVIQ